jgi:hypothetical protein
MPVLAAVRFASTSLSGLLAALFAGNETDVPPPVLPARVSVETSGGTCAVGDVCDDGCAWWTADVGRETDTLCSAAALRRLMGGDALSRALDRARTCAVRHGASCVLSHEVGFQVPAAMVWSSEAGRMRMFLLPRVQPTDDRGQDERRVAIATPPFDVPAASPHVVAMNRTVMVDHVDVQTHAAMREELRDDDAYCMQLLVLSVPKECSDDM